MTVAVQNIKSTNWASLRFKPPPPGSTLGWRTEFRTIDVQLTDFENAAFAIFLVLVVRAFVALSSAPSPEGEELVGLYVPISKVDENMKRAEGRDACRKAKFWWRKNRYARSPSTSGPVEDEYEEASMDEIINGDQAKGKPGLMGLVRNYLDEEGVDEGTKQGLEPYLDLISGRASGTSTSANTPDLRMSDICAHRQVPDGRSVHPELHHLAPVLRTRQRREPSDHVRPHRPPQQHRARTRHGAGTLGSCLPLGRGPDPCSSVHSDSGSGPGPSCGSDIHRSDTEAQWNRQAFSHGGDGRRNGRHRRNVGRLWHLEAIRVRDRSFGGGLVGPRVRGSSLCTIKRDGAVVRAHRSSSMDKICLSCIVAC